MPKAEEAKDEGPRNFGVFLSHVDDGDAVIACSQEMHDLMVALSEEADRTQGTAKGALTLKLDFKVEHSGVVGVTYSIATKEPTPARGGSVFWLSGGKNLVVENPRQKKLPFDVSRPAVEETRDALSEKATPRGV